MLAEIEPILTIVPFLRLAMCGTTTCARRRAEKVLVSKLRRTCSGGISRVAPEMEQDGK